MAIAETAKLLAELGLVDKLTPGLKKAGGSLGRFESRLGRTAGGIGKVSSGLARAGTIVAGAAVTGLGAAAKAAIDWEDAFAGVRKTLDETDVASAGLTFDDIAKSLRDMSKEMPNSAIELAGIAEQAGALGIKAKDIESFTRQVAILASTTNVTADEAATALGQLQNVIGLTGDEFDNFAAALVDLGNKGASTESQILEITRRAGGAAKLIGVAKEATLGWGSAAANLGLQEELAGTALQRFFLGVQNLASDKNGLGKLAAVAAGKTPAAFRKLSSAAQRELTGKFAKTFRKDASGAMEDFLRGLGKLPKDARLKTVQQMFGKGTGLTRLILGLADSIDQNLDPALRDSEQAWKDATAAQVEFEKRNATVKSAISRFRNNIIDAAVTIGEGFAPALGRAADKLSEFLKDPGNVSQLKTLGEDIGKTIDGIDWQQVVSAGKDFVGVMKTAFDWAKRFWDIFNSLPGEIKGATAGLLALNKLSGGLIAGGLGDIVGGVGGAVARGAAGKVPGLGRLVAQPVFVTNWPAGGLAGAGGAAGAAGGLGRAAKFTLGAAAIADIASVIVTQQQVSGQNSDIAEGIKNGLNASIAGKSLPELKTALAAVDSGIDKIQSNPLNVLVQGSALDSLRDMRSSLVSQIAKTETGFRQLDQDSDRVETAQRGVKLAIDGAKRATEIGTGATRSEGAATRHALRNQRPPVVNVQVKVGVAATNVIKKYTTIRRMGPVGGSRDGRGASGPLR